MRERVKVPEVEMVFMEHPDIEDVAGPITRLAFDELYAANGWSLTEERYQDPIVVPAPEEVPPAPSGPPTAPASPKKTDLPDPTTEVPAATGDTARS